MRYVELDDLEKLPGTLIKEGDTFRFRCHQGLACFNRCCRNLNLFLNPYDVLRLKNRLQISSDEFLETHVDVVLREGNHFPDVLLRMVDNAEKTCPFLEDTGCKVYTDRPDSCRMFPIEQGAVYKGQSEKSRLIHFFRPPDFCLGRHEETEFTPPKWCLDQKAVLHNRMTLRWSALKRLFQSDPWRPQGFQGAKGKMAFMATYNIDRFAEFVFQSSFFKRYHVKKNLLNRLRREEAALLEFGFDWVRFYLWGIKSKRFKEK